MAVVIGLTKDSREQTTRHPTEVMGYWTVVPDHGRGPILQISSLKSGERKPYSNHTRQTFQFTRESAHQLFQILKAEFKF